MTQAPPSGDMSCSFCEREPGDFQYLIENKAGDARVCNYCIDEHHEAMLDDAKANSRLNES